MSAGDTIALRGLTCRGFHGVLEHERRDGQTFVVDTVLTLDTAQAAAYDDLRRTVDYGDLAVRLAAVVEGEPVDLIETLATRLAAVCLADPRVEVAEVTVHKPHAPIRRTFGDVSVMVRRHRTPRERVGRSPAVVALGSNLGDRLGWLQRGLDLLATHDLLSVLAVSPVYETEPVGGPGGQDRYLNAVATVRAGLSPAALLGLLHVVEAACERVRDVRWGPRTLDLDLIVSGDIAEPDAAYDGHSLVLPHPRAHERAFVLLPWLDVAADAEIPERGRVAELAATVDSTGIRRRDDLVLEVRE